MTTPYVCFFCGESIADSNVDPCALLAAAAWRDDGFDGRTQQFWCHSACLRAAAHSSVPLYFLTLAEMPHDPDPV